MTVLIWILALVLSAIGGYYTTRGVLALAQRRSISEASHVSEANQISEASQVSQSVQENKASQASKAESASGPNGSAAKDALRGGLWIGLLERVLITAFLMSGFTTGIAVVVAIKGLGRYPELNAATSERFIVGTLASLAWAFACGGLAIWLR